MAKGKRHNWEMIAKDYIEGTVLSDGNIKYPTQRDIAEKYGITPALIGVHAKKEQWLVKREIFNSKIEERRKQKKAETISDEGSAFDLKCFNISQDAADRVNEMLQQAEKPAEVSMLTQALKNLQTVGKAALGDKDGQQEGLTIKVSVSDAD